MKRLLLLSVLFATLNSSAFAFSGTGVELSASEEGQAIFELEKGNAVTHGFICNSLSLIVEVSCNSLPGSNPSACGAVGDAARDLCNNS